MIAVTAGDEERTAEALAAEELAAEELAAEELAAEERRLELATRRAVSSEEERRATPAVFLAYADVLRRRDKVRLAAAQMRRALSAADQVFGKDTLDAAGVALTLARFYVETRQPRDAELVLRRCLGTFERAGDPRAVEARAALSATLVTLGVPLDLTPAPPPPSRSAPAPSARTPEGQALAARVARGDLPAERLRIAAVAGHAAARDALGADPGAPFKVLVPAGPGSLHAHEQLAPDQLSLAGLVRALGLLAPDAGGHAALAAATAALPAWREAADADASVHEAALAVARRWLSGAARGDAELAAVRAAGDACEALARRLVGFKRGGAQRGECSGASLSAALVHGACAPAPGFDPVGLAAGHAAGTADEAAHELAWEGKARRTPARLAEAEREVRAAVSLAVSTWALA